MIDDAQALYILELKPEVTNFLNLFSNWNGKSAFSKSVAAYPYVEDLLVCSSSDTTSGKTVGATNWLSLQ